ncbi:MAG: antibiotic biosynthesis monooxygenase, partial [Pseudomonadota bacterium]
MYIAMTRVRLKPGTAADCAALFEATNPKLVATETDWLGAKMIFDPESEIVTVLATWKTKDAYKHLHQSATFQDTMKQFAAFFAGPPEISMNDVLVDMTPE